MSESAAIPKELEFYVKTVVEKLRNRGSTYVQKVLEIQKNPPKDTVKTQATEPNSGWWFYPYPWWNLFLVGPIQIPGAGGPFQPSKIIAAGETAFFIVVIWRNPAGINWLPGPSACEMLSGTGFQINFELVNLTRVSNVPALENPPITSAFTPSPECLQVFVRQMTFPKPAVDNKPDLYNLYSTMDITAAGVPMAGFASWVLDLDHEPAWWFFPERAPYFKYDEPAQFMVYKK